MNSNLIVQVDIPANELLGSGGGWKYSDHLYRESKSRAMEYAKSTGSDYFCIGKRHVDFRHPTYERFHIYNEMWDSYDNILYLDSDIIIKPDSPDIFEKHGNSGFCAYPVMNIKSDLDRFGIECTSKEIRRFARESEKYYIPEPYLSTRYFNAGVHLVDKPTRVKMRNVLDTYIWDAPVADQTCLNSMIANEEFEYSYLEFEYNTLLGFVHPDQYPKLYSFGYFIHFLGNAKDTFQDIVTSKLTT